jgi:hypothetical protein
MERKDFRPENSSSSSMSDKDRKIIQKAKERRSMERGNTERFGKGYDQPLGVGDRKSIGSTRSDAVNNAFINGESRGKSTDNLHTDGKHLYSYDTVIATRQSDGTFVLNKTKYSATTNKQQSAIERQLKYNGKKYDVTGGKYYGYEGEDFSVEIKDEKAGAEHYEKLSKENPEHKDTLNRMASNERQHAKKLKEIEKESKKPFPVRYLIASDNELDSISRGVAPEVYTHTYGTSKVSDQHKFEARKELEKRDTKNNSITHKEYLKRGYDKDDKSLHLNYDKDKNVDKAEVHFNLDSKADYKMAESYKSRLENSGYKVKTESYGVNGVKITGTKNTKSKFRKLNKTEQEKSMRENPNKHTSYYNKKYPKDVTYNRGDIEVKFQKEGKQMRAIVFDNRDRTVHDYYGKNKKDALEKAKRHYPKHSK